MAVSKRPAGRQKRVGLGSTSVSRRGSESNFNPRIGGSRAPKSSLSILILLAAGAYFLFKLFLGGDLVDTNMPASVETERPLSQLDYQAPGAYEVDRTVAESANDKRTEIVGNGKDVVTLMIYMIGTDLESRSGMGTADLNEMLYAQISEQVNIILQTGGTKKWQNSVISSKTNQRYQLTSDGMILIEDNLGPDSMVNSDTLSEFIRYTKKNYPADRYQLILWDHGGGSLTGYGYDELYPGDHMSLDEIKTALDDGDTVFDFIGFDACLMATLETALVLEPYADYMIASEELEPGSGWYYSDWITTLSENTSIDTIDLGKKIIDDYISVTAIKEPRTQATLSLIDLAELKGTVSNSLSNFAKSTNVLITGDDYQLIADARSGSKEFSASSKINQIDLVHFARNIGTKEALNLAEDLIGMVKYNRTSTNIGNAYGVSVYFPYDNLGMMKDVISTYESIGMDQEYTNAIKGFASITAGGQVVGNASGSGNLLGTLLGTGSQDSGNQGSESQGSEVIQQLLNTFISNGDFSSITGLLGGEGNWLDTDLIANSAKYYGDNQFDPSALKLTNKNGQKVIELSEEQWALIQELELNVFIDDGEGFIDLGLDNVYEWTADGDLIMEFDGTWLTLNGHIVSYYMISSDYRGDDYYIKGRIPAMLNNQRVDIIVAFDQDNPYGNVLGAMTDYDAVVETATEAKGLIEIVAGDTIDYLCNYYSYDGDYTDSYYLGDAYTVTGDWVIENLALENITYQMAYRLTDIYNNHYWTPTISE